jgi:hypothetical protein
MALLTLVFINKSAPASAIACKTMLTFFIEHSDSKISIQLFRYKEFDDNSSTWQKLLTTLLTYFVVRNELFNYTAA